MVGGDYASWYRLNGGYDNIGIGGHTSNAMVDFTGGISEAIDLRQRRTSPGDLFDVMCAMMKCSMMSCSIRVAISHHCHPSMLILGLALGLKAKFLGLEILWPWP